LERKIEKILNEKGYFTHRARQSYFKSGRKIYSISNDIFGQFDIIAKKKNKPTLWIQISTGYRKTEKLNKLKLLPDIFNDFDLVILILKIKNKLKYYIYSDSEYIEFSEQEFYELI